MIKLEDINKEILFKEEPHTYHFKEQGLLSVSVFLSLFKSKFDPSGFIKRKYAEKNNLSVSEVTEKWDKAKYDGLKRGKSFHRQIEHFLKNNEILKDDYEDVVLIFKEKFLPKIKGKLYCEIPLHLREPYWLAGTADLIEDLGKGNLNLMDWKTNKEILYKPKYGGKLLPPVDYLGDCEMSNYGLQLNLYKYMLEYHGYKVKKITLFHINPETRQIDSHKIPDMQEDIIKMLNHYKESFSF
jgi:hypothetical protein